MELVAWLTHHLCRSDHITDALVCLHWLCVPERFQYKIAILVYKVLHGLAGEGGVHSNSIANFPGRRPLRPLPLLRRYYYISTDSPCITESTYGIVMLSTDNRCIATSALSCLAMSVSFEWPDSGPRTNTRDLLPPHKSFTVTCRHANIHTTRNALVLEEVAADWHELMTERCIVRSSFACTSEQLDPWCSQKTGLPVPQSATLGLHPTASELLLISNPTKGTKMS